MKDALDAFLSSIPVSDSILAKRGDAVVLFGFFLSEIAGKAIAPAAITECYGAAHLKHPKNMSDTMSKSGGFVKNKTGWALQRDAIARVKALVPTTTSAPSDSPDDDRRKTIMVVYGRDEDTRRDMFSFLHSLRLLPIEWNDAVARTGKASPYVGEILKTAFSMAQAFLVLMTPDEQVVLRPELCKTSRDANIAFQPRPNVILEAGMALASDEARTILVSTGVLRGMSDLDGRHVVRLDNSAERRNDLVQRLKVAWVPSEDRSFPLDSNWQLRAIHVEPPEI
jgi:predicted nucleotide-binding protein